MGPGSSPLSGKFRDLWRRPLVGPTPVGGPEIALLVVQMVRGLEIGTPTSYPQSYPSPPCAHTLPHPHPAPTPTPLLAQPGEGLVVGSEGMELGNDQRPNPKGHQPSRS